MEPELGHSLETQRGAEGNTKRGRRKCLLQELKFLRTKHALRHCTNLGKIAPLLGSRKGRTSCYCFGSDNL